MVRVLSTLLLALAGFVVTARLVQPLTPPPPEFALRDKWEHFREHKDEYEVLVIGSSIVYRSFVPEVVDAELAEHGYPWRLYNFGVGNMRAFEASHMLREILDLEPARLRLVVVELRDWDARTGFANLFTRRMTFWHDLEHTRLALHSLAIGGAPEEQRRAMALEHGKLALRKATNVGDGPRIADALLGLAGEREYVSTEALDRGRGFVALDDELDESYRAQHEGFRADYEAAGGVWSRVAPNKRWNPMSPRGNRRAFEAQMAAVEAAGAELVYVVGPVASRVPEPNASSFPPAERILHYADPATHADLYRLENRFDLGHVNGRGAELFSRRFARDLAAWLRSRGVAGER